MLTLVAISLMHIYQYQNDSQNSEYYDHKKLKALNMKFNTIQSQLNLNRPHGYNFDPFKGFTCILSKIIDIPSFSKSWFNINYKNL